MNAVNVLYYHLCLLVFISSFQFGEAEWRINATLDSCYEERGGLFPCSSTITGNVLLMIFYGAILGGAAKLISDGAEMLLDFGMPPSIIGGVVLPILGAVPDSAIIVASGMGKNSQEKLSVGMGTLAGSTVMLLTIAWSASVTVARCDINENGVSVDQTYKGSISLTKQGITPLPELKSGIYIMFITSLFYLIVQSADWHWGATLEGNQPEYVKQAALATMVMCVIGFIIYIVFSIFDSKRTDRIQKLHREELMKRKVLHTILTLTNKQIFKPPATDEDGTNASSSDIEQEDSAAVSKKYFKAWHMKKGVRSLEEKQNTDGEKEALLQKEKDIAASVVDEEPSQAGDSKLISVLKCVLLLIGGVALVTVFSDPMCEVLTSLINKNNKSYIPIPVFYVSFIVTPFCSNASELVSSLIFASKKTRENATMTFSQLFGAATMNNTMCLAIFMGLVYFKDLEWIYGAEVISIILVQWVVGIVSLSKTYKLWMGIPVAVTYVLCILIVYLLEYAAGWH